MLNFTKSYHICQYVLTTCCTTCYHIGMLKTYLYIPEHLNEEINMLVSMHKTSKAEVLRSALQEGIKHIKHNKTNSAAILLKLADIGKKHNFTGPKDSSTRM